MVGLLPAAISSFDIKNFVEGGKKFLKSMGKEKNFNSFFHSSLAIILSQKKGINISVIMPYIDNLNNFPFGTNSYGQKVLGKKNGDYTS